MTQIKKCIPALPVVNIAKAVQFYDTKMGFKARHQEDTFAIIGRDGVEIHLWAACDKSWRFTFLLRMFNPIRTGAESFLAGTTSCRIEVTGVDDLYLEYKETGVLYNSDVLVEEQYWGHRDFPTLDLYGNLLTFYEVN